MTDKKEILQKHEDLILNLGANAPHEKSARHFFFEGAKVALSEYVDSEEIECIVERANKLIEDFFELVDEISK